MNDDDVGFAINRDNGVLIVTFNRPAFGNALTREATPLLTELFVSVKNDPAVRALLFRGEGRIFSAGGDVRGFSETLQHPANTRRENYGARLDHAATLVGTFLSLDIPIVAACQGAVAGAGMLYALGADLVLADETVKFVFAHQRIGLPPDSGISVLLPRAVGERKATELVITAASVNANEALRLGLVSRLSPPDKLQAEALQAAHRFATAPQRVIRRAKRLIAGSLLRPLEEQLRAERDAVVESVTEPDFDEGVRAFLEKRKAQFPSAVG